MGQGRDAVKALLKDNPELLAELEDKIKDKIKGNDEILVDTHEPNILDDGSDD